MSGDPSANNNLILEFIAGSRTGERAEIENDREYILGRGVDADVLIDHKKASRRHARIFPRGGGHAIEDLGSINGTIVNGERVKEKDLFPGDSIQIADARMRVRGARAEQQPFGDRGGRRGGVGSHRGQDSYPRARERRCRPGSRSG